VRFRAPLNEEIIKQAIHYNYACSDSTYNAQFFFSGTATAEIKENYKSEERE
jgi:hypothetical protein